MTRPTSPAVYHAQETVYNIQKLETELAVYVVKAEWLKKENERLRELLLKSGNVKLEKNPENRILSLVMSIDGDLLMETGVVAFDYALARCRREFEGWLKDQGKADVDR